MEKLNQDFINMKVEKQQNPLATIKLDNNDQDDIDENVCGQDNELETIQPKIKKIINKKICYKCKTNKSNYLNRTEFICKDCLLKNLNHKFRSNLRAHCKIKHEDYVLVCVSGGASSMAMLHWFNTTFNDKTSNRKLFFKLKVLHVDSSVYYINNSTKEEMQEKRNKTKTEFENLCKGFGFNVEIINLENIMKINNPHLDDENSLKEYISLYNKICKIGSFNEDFNKIMTRNCIFDYAIQNNFNKIVFGNCAQSLVNNIFSTVVKGRGFSLREEVGYIDTHYLKGKITVLKPLRDFLSREILLYNHMSQVNLMYSPLDLVDLEYPTLNSKINLPHNGNTHNLIKHFFDNLQDKMSSTITTVMGTAEKLKVREPKDCASCEFCLDYADEVYNQLEIGSIDSISNE
jgi:tRNA(Ile)-lysidine synthase TilS/MesJ